MTVFFKSFAFKQRFAYVKLKGDWQNLPYVEFANNLNVLTKKVKFYAAYAEQSLDKERIQFFRNFFGLKFTIWWFF